VCASSSFVLVWCDVFVMIRIIRDSSKDLTAACVLCNNTREEEEGDLCYDHSRESSILENRRREILENVDSRIFPGVHDDQSRESSTILENSREDVVLLSRDNFLSCSFTRKSQSRPNPDLY
jgi:tRNA(Ile)-lysidine synthase TilS/MesJ